MIEWIDGIRLAIDRMLACDRNQRRGPWVLVVQRAADAYRPEPSVVIPERVARSWGEAFSIGVDRLRGRCRRVTEPWQERCKIAAHNLERR